LFLHRRSEVGKSKWVIKHKRPRRNGGKKQAKKQSHTKGDQGGGEDEGPQRRG